MKISRFFRLFKLFSMIVRKIRNDGYKFKKTIYTTLLIFWMIIIFLFSNQDAAKSESTSDKVTLGIINITEAITNQKIQEEKRNDLIEETRFLIRKLAHFTLYFILGIFVYLTLHSYSIERILLISIFFCFLYACSDEIHQMFSDGRAAQLLDVLIDTLGASIGILLIFMLNKKLKIRL